MLNQYPTHAAPVHANEELQRLRHNYGIDGEYILPVGSIQPRKSLPGSSRFNWLETARKTLAVYKEIAQVTK